MATAYSVRGSRLSGGKKQRAEFKGVLPAGQRAFVHGAGHIVD
jgi:hypothetical protein